MEKEEKIEVEYPVPPESHFIGHLKNIDSSLWFYIVLLTCLSTFISIYLIQTLYPMVLLRWVLASIFILFLPGYSLVEALFPKRSVLDGIERFALSIGLSIAVTPLIGLLLNYTPWGIRLEPLVISLSIFTLSMSFLASYRKFVIGKTVNKWV